MHFKLHLAGIRLRRVWRELRESKWMLALGLALGIGIWTSAHFTPLLYMPSRMTLALVLGGSALLGFLDLGILALSESVLMYPEPKPLPNAIRAPIVLGLAAALFLFANLSAHAVPFVNPYGSFLAEFQLGQIYCMMFTLLFTMLIRDPRKDSVTYNTRRTPAKAA